MHTNAHTSTQTHTNAHKYTQIHTNTHKYTQNVCLGVICSRPSKYRIHILLISISVRTFGIWDYVFGLGNMKFSSGFLNLKSSCGFWNLESRCQGSVCFGYLSIWPCHMWWSAPWHNQDATTQTELYMSQPNGYRYVNPWIREVVKSRSRSGVPHNTTSQKVQNLLVIVASFKNILVRRVNAHWKASNAAISLRNHTFVSQRVVS